MKPVLSLFRVTAVFGTESLKKKRSLQMFWEAFGKLRNGIMIWVIIWEWANITSPSRKGNSLNILFFRWRKKAVLNLAHKIRKCWENVLHNSISDFLKFFFSLGFHLQSWPFPVWLLNHQASMLSLFCGSQALRVKKYLPQKGITKNAVTNHCFCTFHTS